MLSYVNNVIQYNLSHDLFASSSPFSSAEEAVKEFEKIFKSKTGNLWSERHNFVRKPKKYRLMEINYNHRQMKELLQPYDWDKLPVKSNLPDELQVTMKIISNVTMLQKALRSTGKFIESFPFC